MSTRRSREMSTVEMQTFTNAIRECLGLEPLYGKEAFREQEPEPWWAVFIGTGNRRTPRRQGTTS